MATVKVSGGGRGWHRWKGAYHVCFGEGQRLLAGTRARSYCTLLSTAQPPSGGDTGYSGIYDHALIALRIARRGFLVYLSSVLIED